MISSVILLYVILIKYQSLNWQVQMKENMTMGIKEVAIGHF